MTGKAKPIPEGFHSITPGLICKDAGRAIDYYKSVLGAKERMRMPTPDGKVAHAELQIGDSILFVGDEFPHLGALAPTGPQSCSLFVYVEDVDTVFKHAVAAGARVDMPVADQFWGDRYGKLTDPFGHHWALATHIEDVALEEMDRRAGEFAKKMAAKA